jgi:hypothetical protein
MMIALALLAFAVSGYLVWNAAHRRNPIDDLRDRLTSWVDSFERAPAPADRGLDDPLDDLGDTPPIENDQSASPD